MCGGGDNSGYIVGNPECAGINRHIVGNERALQERRQRLHPGLESCRCDREKFIPTFWRTRDDVIDIEWSFILGCAAQLTSPSRGNSIACALQVIWIAVLSPLTFAQPDTGQCVYFQIFVQSVRI